MIYRLLNKLFGWDYIYWSNSCDSGTARVFKSPEGSAYYWRYRFAAHKILSRDSVIWLTCHPAEYGL